ncbi:MAG: hypothetical protein COB53_03000 [Elusimicrobia bacterium]|nr:MAG: hypothetical protein COB53_03000 [Elusimicrobiota bacterium]
MDARCWPFKNLHPENRGPLKKRNPYYRWHKSAVIARAALCAAGILILGPAPLRAENVLRICDDAEDPMTLDPHRQFSEKNHTLVQQIFDGIVRFNPEGEIEPALAVSWHRISDTVMRFNLRKNVRFHNGESFDAESVQFSINRYLNPKTAFPAFGYIRSLKRVDIIDSHTIDLVTHTPDGLLMNRLAGFILIVPKAYYSKHSLEHLKRNPIGTGAFRFTRWQTGNRVELQGNSEYWVKGLPTIDKLVFEFLPYSEQVDALLAGKLDIITHVPGTRTLEVQQNPSTRIIKKPALFTMAANFNMNHPPLDDLRVRKAINLAVNVDDLIRYDIFGNGIAIGTLSLPGEPGNDPSIKPYPFDLKEAKRLMRKSGHEKGFTLRTLLKVNAERTGRILAKQLLKIGIHLDFTLMSDAELYASLKDRKLWDMAIYSCPDPMHHAHFIRSIFLDGKSPFSLTADPDVDSRIAKIESTIDEHERDELSRELDRLIHNKYLALPTYQRLGVVGLKNGVDFTPYKSGMPYLFSTRAATEKKHASP